MPKPCQQSLKLSEPGLTSGYEVRFVSLATLEALPETVRASLRPHFDERMGEGMVALRDCEDVRRALGGRA